MPILSGSKLRVALVEDEPLIMILLEDLVTAMGHEVCVMAATQDEAIGAILKQMPDLMIIDCRLRQGNGLDVVAHVLDRGFMPHIYMTGDRLRQNMLHPSAVILPKPFFYEDLVEAIDLAMQKGAPASGGLKAQSDQARIQRSHAL